MAKRYHLTQGIRVANALTRALLRAGFPTGSTYLLSVQGRKSGRLLSTPVTLIEDKNQRWLVAPYGEVNWVRNARAAGQVTLSRGRHRETFALVELDPSESAPILQTYLRRVRVVQPYFDLTPDAPLASFEAEAAQHPVFLLVSSTAV
jgi:deazaflavin-dependent oxidoreductase (nitroreductase family)